MIGDIMRDVADLHNVTVADIRGRKRHKHIAAARHAAIWVLRQVCTTMTEQKIAEAVGLTDHTTVVYALKKVEKIVAQGDAYAANLCQIVNDRKGIRSFVAPAEPPQRLPNSVDWWAKWHAARKGTTSVEAA
jgi:hypothetical protein